MWCMIASQIKTGRDYKKGNNKWGFGPYFKTQIRKHMDSSNSMKFINITEVVSVFASEEKPNEMYITVIDSKGQFNVLVMHPSLVYSIKQFTTEAIVEPQENAQ